MPYILIEDFKYGIDRRRPRFAGIPGTLWDAVNCHLSRGGDLERCKAFTEEYTGLSGTFGLASLNGAPYVFGSGDLAASMPAGMQYQRLQAASASDMTKVLDVKTFDNKFYVIAEYASGARHHFYNGTRVTDWDTVAASLANTSITFRALALKIALDSAVSVVPTNDGVIVTARVPGTAFTIAAATSGGGGASTSTVQANVAGVAETRATGQIQITGGSFDPGVNRVSAVLVTTGGSFDYQFDLIGGPVDWISSDVDTATAVALAINEMTSVHGYSASASGDTITVTAPVGLGTVPNGYYLDAVVEGNATTSGTTNLSGGVDAIEPVAQVSQATFGGPPVAADVLTVTINGTAYAISGTAAATGTAVHVQDNRVWSVAGAALAYCKLNDPSDWTDATVTTGAGQIVVSTDSEGAQVLTAISSYRGNAAVFSENAIIVYALGTDPAEFTRVQEIPNNGTLAGGSVKSYGANDVFFLDKTGIRSLQSKDSSGIASVSDAGTAFDPFVRDLLAETSRNTIADAMSVIEPETGAYWLAIGDTILVFTNYPGTNIRGWTRYDPGFDVAGMARIGDRVYVRDATSVYVYGGTEGADYPAAGELPVTVKLPFVAARDEAGLKQFLGFDLGATGAWSVTALVNPKDETETIAVGILQGVTYADENAEMVGETSHLALELVCSGSGFASLSSLALHHTGKLRA